jgi:hypothetical protein
VKPRFFATPAAWRKWLAANHARETTLWVGFWKVTCDRPSITWPQSVDQALCFGWIDGLRRGIDAESYMIRFSPRKPDSKWSRVNLKRFAELDAEGLVHAAGRAARAKWDDAGEAGYSHERGPVQLDADGGEEAQGEREGVALLAGADPVVPEDGRGLAAESQAHGDARVATRDAPRLLRAREGDPAGREVGEGEAAAVRSAARSNR